VFVKPNGGWKTTYKSDAKLLSSNKQDASRFGFSVSVNGSGPNGRQFVVVGSPHEDNYAGAAYVYVSSPTGGWTNDSDKDYRVENYRLVVSPGKRIGNLQLGTAVSSDNKSKSQTVVIGTRGESAFVYVPGVEPGQKPVWSPVRNVTQTETATLTRKNDKSKDFGRAISFSGDTIAIGAPDGSSDPSNPSGPGAAYVFLVPAGGWKEGMDYNESATLRAPDGKAGDRLGQSVSTNGSKVIAGAPDKNNSAGGVYVFTGPGAGWKDVTQLTDPENAEKGDFGWSVSIAAGAANPVVTIGSVHATGGKGGKVKDAGAVFVFTLVAKKPGVQLDQRTSPEDGAVGVNYLSVSGFGFQEGNINPANVVVQFAATCGETALVTATAVAAVSGSGDSRLVSFLIPAGLPPGKYFVSVSDSADGDAGFESGNCSEVDVSQ
jgi:hypothetical protein